jgi:hypothetical protein
MAVGEGGGGSAPDPIVTKWKSLALCVHCFGEEGSWKFFLQKSLA